jgi:Fe-S-cluster containining protein
MERGGPNAGGDGDGARGRGRGPGKGFGAGYPSPFHDDIDRPSTWTRWRNGLCEGCHARCCTLPVEASPEDMVRLGFLSEDEARGSMKKVTRALGKQGVVRHYREKSRLFTLAQRPNGDCVFLGAETRKCTVYETRPDVCRRFPDVGPRPGFCPATRAQKR